MTNLARPFYDGEKLWPEGTSIDAIPALQEVGPPKSALNPRIIRGYAEMDARERQAQADVRDLSKPLENEPPEVLSAGLPKATAGVPSTLSEATLNKVAKK